MNGSLNSFDNMHNSQVCDKSEYHKIGEDLSKLGMSAGEGKCVADDGDDMPYTACSTKIFSEMATLESIPTLSYASFFDNPLFEELPEPTPLSDNDVAARQAALRWRGKNLRGVQTNALQQHDSPTASSKFNLRKLQMPNKWKENNSKEATTATKEDKIEFEGRPVELFFNELRKQSGADFRLPDDDDDLTFLSGDDSFFDAHKGRTPAGKASDHTSPSGVYWIDTESRVQASDAKKMVPNEVGLCSAPPKQSSSLESCERSNTMRSIADMSLSSASSVLAGPPGRALRKNRAATMFA